jgi:UDP-glucose 4-epimerase
VRGLNLSFYPESQGAFAERVRREVAKRLGWWCTLELATQTEFPKPPVRINIDLCDVAALAWSETHTWDDFVAYYTS